MLHQNKGDGTQLSVASWDPEKCRQRATRLPLQPSVTLLVDIVLTRAEDLKLTPSKFGHCWKWIAPCSAHWHAPAVSLTPNFRILSTCQGTHLANDPPHQPHRPCMAPFLNSFLKIVEHKWGTKSGAWVFLAQCFPSTTGPHSVWGRCAHVAHECAQQGGVPFPKFQRRNTLPVEFTVWFFFYSM